MKNKKRFLVLLSSTLTILITSLLGCNTKEDINNDGYVPIPRAESTNDGYVPIPRAESTNDGYVPIPRAESTNDGYVPIPTANVPYAITNNTIENLMTTSDRYLPYSIFKVLRYVDQNNNEQVRIVKAIVQFIFDSERNIIDITYDYYDIFNDELIATSKIDFSKADFREVSNQNILCIMSFGELVDLKDIAISRGMDCDYVEEIVNDSIKGNNLLISDVADMYLRLFNKNSNIKKLN